MPIFLLPTKHTKKLGNFFKKRTFKIQDIFNSKKSKTHFKSVG